MSSAAVCNVKVATDSMPPYNALFRRIAAKVPRVSTISITDSICPNGVCTPNVNGLLVRYDGEHFSPPTAKWLAPVIYRQLVAVGLPK
jgi:hypothetical protein